MGAMLNFRTSRPGTTTLWPKAASQRYVHPRTEATEKRGFQDRGLKPSSAWKCVDSDKYNGEMAAESGTGCLRKEALLQDVQRAMGELMVVHNSELAALLADDFDLLVELKSKVQKAREKKTRLIDLYREHVQSHGC